MAYVYKIVNDINNKVYVGKTVQTQEERFLEHLRAVEKNQTKNRPLYRAMKKYGKDHFSIEQIEECDVDEVNEREIYWIAKQNSYDAGYNATKGGEGKFKYDYAMIYSLYKQGYTASQISRMLRYDVSSCIDILCYMGIPHKDIWERGNNSKKKPVQQIDAQTGKIIKVHSSVKEASTNCGFKCASVISNAARTGCLGYGYYWRYLNADNNENDIPHQHNWQMQPA